MAELLLSLIRSNNPKFVFKNTIESWAADIDKLNRIDKQPWADIEKILRFSQSDPFWKINILSGKTFRAKWNQLTMKAQTVFTTAPGVHQPGPTPVEQRRQLTA